MELGPNWVRDVPKFIIRTDAEHGKDRSNVAVLLKDHYGRYYGVDRRRRELTSMVNPVVNRRGRTVAVVYDTARENRKYLQ